MLTAADTGASNRAAGRGIPATSRSSSSRWLGDEVGSGSVRLQEVLRDRAWADGGIAGLPTFVAEAEVFAGRLVTVLHARTLRSSGGFYPLYPSRGQTPRKVEAFCDFMIGFMKAKPLM